MQKHFAAILILLALAGGMDARSKRKPKAAGAPGQFDYYLLSLSWAPDFCDKPSSSKTSRECATGNKVGFIVHGLWPQNNNGTYPENCQSARPVASGIVTQMLPIMMDAGLVQHEWATHGTCTGLTTDAYFTDIRQIFASLNIPSFYRTLNKTIQVSPGEVDSAFASANPSLAKGAIRTACSGNELSEVHICFTKDLKAQACPATARECSASSMTMLPLR